MKKIKAKELDYIYKVSEMDIVYNVKVKASERIKVTDSYSMAAMFRERIGQKIEYCEQMYMAVFNRSLQVLGVSKISEGDASSASVNLSKILQVAILSNAQGVAICHNHPGGNYKPSADDKKATDRIKQGLELVGIHLVDHIIVTEESYYSFDDNHMFL